MEPLAFCPLFSSGSPTKQALCSFSSFVLKFKKVHFHQEVLSMSLILPCGSCMICHIYWRDVVNHSNVMCWWFLFKSAATLSSLERIWFTVSFRVHNTLYRTFFPPKESQRNWYIKKKIFMESLIIDLNSHVAHRLSHTEVKSQSEEGNEETTLMSPSGKS